MNTYMVRAWCPGGCGWLLPNLQDRQGEMVWVRTIYLWMSAPVGLTAQSVGYEVLFLSAPA